MEALLSSKKGTFRAPFHIAFQCLQTVKLVNLLQQFLFTDIPAELEMIYIAKINYIKCLKSLPPIIR